MISDLLKPESVIISNEKFNFENALEALIEVIEINPESKPALKDLLIKREELISSRLGKGVMIFRAWPVEADNAYFSLGIFPEGLDVETFDGEDIKIAGLLAAPKNREHDYHENLVSVLRLFNENSLRDDLLLCEDASKIIELIKEEETEFEKSV
ncbi:PTS sugar transporter subunit IIA [candidate division WOR-3 bacterium]|nr:PTS sugar transporter subunit IIA [candidate division WOR-3 bacterium]